MARSQRSRRDSKTHKHHGEISTNLGEISVISARWRISRRDLTEIQNVTNIMARSLQSRRVLSNLGEMEDMLQVNLFPTQVNLFQPRSICSNLGHFVSTQVNFIYFFVLVANKKIFLAPLIFSSSSFFSLSPLYLPHLLFPPCSPNIPAPILFIPKLII